MNYSHIHTEDLEHLHNEYSGLIHDLYSHEFSYVT